MPSPCAMCTSLTRFCREGGVQAIAGTSNFGTITAQMANNETYKLAYDVFLDRLLNYIGAYFLKLRSSPEALDGIVFSGGIGERSANLRRDVAGYFAWLGCGVDDAANDAGPKDGTAVTRVTKDGSKVRIFVCLTVSPFSWPLIKHRA